MIVLVRCSDGTYAVALESRIENLLKDGLISAVLCNGTWLKSDYTTPLTYEAPAITRKTVNAAAMVASF